MMRTTRRFIEFAKALGKTVDMRVGASLQSPQSLQNHCSQHFDRSRLFPLAVHRPWPSEASGGRCIHGSAFARQNTLEESESPRPVPVSQKVDNHLPATSQSQKPRVVVLGAGWAGCRLMKDLNSKLYDIVCVSPRNHMVFTPLLASTCVGTLEFRSVAESVRTIQPAIAREKDSYFFLARCTSIDSDSRTIHCKALGKEETADFKGSGEFSIAYDKLVIALGAQSVTFNIPGVHEHAIFLREVGDARAVRSKLLLNLAMSDVPGVTEDEKRKILHCVVVGGGPTGVEFSGELSDFIKRDVVRKFSHVKDYIHVTLIEANEILSSFDVRLRQYAARHLGKAGVRLVTGMVKEVQDRKLILSDGTDVSYGLLVWSTGVGPSDFVKSLACEKSPGGRIGVDDHLRVPELEDVYAIGDCSGYLESSKKLVLPALAQVAERQGKYVAKLLNSLGEQGGGKAGAAAGKDYGSPFKYKHLGSMATVGSYKALVDLRESKENKGISIAGFTSFLIWRSAYLSRLVSWRNRIYVAINWATTFLFGRDISRL